MSKSYPFWLVLLAAKLAFAGQTTRTVPINASPSVRVSNLPSLSLPALGAGLKLQGLDTKTGVVLPDIQISAPGLVPTSQQSVVPAVLTAPSQGAAPAVSRIQASSPEKPAIPGAFSSTQEGVAQPLKVLAEGKSGGEGTFDAGRQLEDAMTGGKKSDGGAIAVSAPAGASYVQLLARGIHAPLPNPAEYYADAFEQAALLFAKKGFSREEVRFGGVTGSLPAGDVHLAFTFFASKSENPKAAPAVYVDYAPHWARTNVMMGSRVMRTDGPVPVYGSVFGGVSQPYFFSRGALLGPESALASAKAALSRLSSSVSFSLRYEKDSATGDLDPVYRFYDDDGNVAAVNARTGAAVTVAEAALPLPVSVEEQAIPTRWIFWTAAATTVAQALFQSPVIIALSLLAGIAFSLTLWRGWNAGLVRGKPYALALGLLAGSALSLLGSYVMPALLMTGMMMPPRAPLPNPSEYYEDAYEYAVMQAEKLGYERADVRFGGVTGTLPVPVDRHLMFTFYATKTAADKQGAIFYVDYAPKWGVLRGRMGSVGAIFPKGPLEGPVFDGADPKLFKLSPEQALDAARARHAALEVSSSFKLAFESSDAPWYSFYDGLGNHVKVQAATGEVRVITAAPEKAKLEVKFGDWKTWAIVVALALLAAAAIAAFGTATNLLGAVVVGGALGFGAIRDLSAFDAQMKARFGRMRGVTSVSVESDKRTRVIIEFGNRAALEKAKAGRRIPGTTQGATVIARLNAEAQAAERQGFEAEAKKRFGTLEGLATLKLSPETGDARSVVLEFSSPAALAAAKTKGLPQKLDRLFVTPQLTPAAAEQERQRLENERLAKEAAEKERREFAVRLRAAFPDAPGFVRASRVDGKILVEATGGAGSYPATFEGLPVVVQAAPAQAVTDAQIEASVKGLAHSKGRPWSSTEYNMMYAGSLESLRKSGATEWQLERFSDLEALEPVRGGGFNPWSGD